MKNNHFLSLSNYLKLKKSESKFFEVLYYIYVVLIFYAVLYVLAYGLGYLVAKFENFQFYKVFFN
jgi:ABC-type sugar transport system permease subunit